MDDFFKSFPEAKSIWRAGDRYFLFHAKGAAELYAAQAGLKVEEWTKMKADVAKKKAAKNK